jgi:site-specific DNA recombinase
MTKAAIYVRISADSTGEGLGVARQEADCRKLAAAKGWEVLKVYSDNDTTAYRTKARPAYAEMMAALRTGTADAVVVYHLDRLYRRPRELEDLIDLCESGRVKFAAVSGEIDLSESAGRTMARVVVAFANQSSADTSRRQLRKMTEVAEQGRPHGGPRPYGFESDRVTIIEHEAGVIREMAAALLAGTSLRSLCARLNDRGDLTPFGKPWESSVISRMLVRARLIGKRDHNGELTPAVWPAIITESEAIQLRAILTGRRRAASRRHLLSGLAWCGVCGAKLQHSSGWGPNKTGYSCPPPPRGRRCVAIMADGLEAHVIKTVLDLAPTDYGTPILTVYDTTADRERLNELAEAFAAGTITMRQLQTATKAIQDRIAEHELRNRIGAEAAFASATMHRLRDRWDGLTFDERRFAVVEVVDRITVQKATRTRVFDPARIEIGLTFDAYNEWLTNEDNRRMQQGLPGLPSPLTAPWTTPTIKG